VIWLTGSEETRELLVDEKPYLSLELQAVDSYVYVYRAPGNSSILVLEPSNDDRVRCCLIGNEDLIKFSSTNSVITVNVPRDNSHIQVGSSIPADVHSPTPKPSTSLQIVAETPTARHVKTPESSSESVQFSTAKMPVMTEDDDDEANEAPQSEPSTANNNVSRELDFNRSLGRDDKNLAPHPDLDINKIPADPQLNLDGEIKHISPERTSSDHFDPSEENMSSTDSEGDKDEDSVRQNINPRNTAKKRRADADADADNDDELVDQSSVIEVANPSKKRRAEANQDDDDETPRASKRSRSSSIPRITLIDEEFGKDDDLLKPKKRGRPKKPKSEKVATPKPQQRGSLVVIPSKTKKTDTPSSTAKSSKAATNSFDTTPSKGAKPTVVFSGSNFKELTQLLKNFKNLATVTEEVTERTDYVW
jgi:hypothetical protein